MPSPPLPTTTPTPPTPPPATNQYRQPPLRYLGYANELGEAFHPVLPPSLKLLYPASYAVAMAYVLADSKRCVELKPPGQSGGAVFADALLWQTAASVAIPGFVIGQIVKASNRAAAKGGVRSKMVGTFVGLASIPLIISPIDHGVDYVMDNSIRNFLFDDAGKKT